MDKFRAAAKFLVFVFILSSLIISSIGDDGGKEEKQRPNAAERAIGITTPIPAISPWLKLKSWMKLAWMSFRPSPDSERSERGGSSAGEVVKEAVSKSYETSKGTAEHAAKVAGDAVHQTAEKVKRSVSGSGGDTDEEL